LYFVSGELENGGYVQMREQASTMLKSNKLGIIIPYKDRFDELLEFVPHIDTFLNDQHVLHEIFVINQVIGYRQFSTINVNVIFLKMILYLFRSISIVSIEVH